MWARCSNRVHPRLRGCGRDWSWVTLRGGTGTGSDGLINGLGIGIRPAMSSERIFNIARLLSVRVSIGEPGVG